MREIFFQITLSLSSAFVGAVIQLMPRRWQVNILKVFGGVLAAILLIWVGYELGVSFR